MKQFLAHNCGIRPGNPVTTSSSKASPSGLSCPPDVDAFPSPATTQGPPVPAYIRTDGAVESQSATGSGGGNTSPAGGTTHTSTVQRTICQVVETIGVLSSELQHSAIQSSKEVQFSHTPENEIFTSTVHEESSHLQRKCNLVEVN